MVASDDNKCCVEDRTEVSHACNITATAKHKCKSYCTEDKDAGLQECGHVVLSNPPYPEDYDADFQSPV